MSEASCPKCGFERPEGALDCGVCGIVFARYRGAETEPPPAVPEAASWPGAADPVLVSPDPPPPEARAEEQNPYAAPRALILERDVEPATGQELADRSTRLGAVLLNMLILFALVMVFAMMIGFLGEELAAVGVVFMVVAMLALLIYNLVLLDRSGQSIGKKLLGIKIVRLSGERVSLGRLILFRWLPVQLISGIPALGAVFALLNAGFIFRDDHRCLHDHMADTIVVKAPKV